MKKILFATLAIFLAVQVTIVAQPAKKPTIMVVPSDNWCQENGYMQNFNNQGSVVSLPDYRKALQGNYDLGAVIAKIGELMAERGFPLVDMEATLKRIETDAARSSMMSSDDSGSMLAESPIDILNRTAKADIMVQVGWKINERGPSKIIHFILKGVDAYTYKPVANSSGEGKPSMSATTVTMLETAVLANIDQFNSQLLAHFDDLFTNGREGALVVQVWDDSPVHLESEFQLKGKTAELKRIINSFWMPRNTKEGRFTQDSDVTRNRQKFTQVRIPLVGDDGWGGEVAYDFTMFGETLADFLKTEFGITTKVVPRGLGEVNLILGGK